MRKLTVRRRSLRPVALADGNPRVSGYKPSLRPDQIDGLVALIRGLKK